MCAALPLPNLGYIPHADIQSPLLKYAFNRVSLPCPQEIRMSPNWATGCFLNGLFATLESWFIPGMTFPPTLPAPLCFIISSTHPMSFHEPSPDSFSKSNFTFHKSIIITLNFWRVYLIKFKSSRYLLTIYYVWGIILKSSKSICTRPYLRLQIPHNLTRERKEEKTCNV